MVLYSHSKKPSIHIKLINLIFNLKNNHKKNEVWNPPRPGLLVRKRRLGPIRVNRKSGLPINVDFNFIYQLMSHCVNDTGNSFKYITVNITSQLGPMHV